MRVHTIIALMLCLLSCLSSARQISANITAVDELWTSAHFEHGGLLPSEWYIPNALPTGETLIPGSSTSALNQNVILSNGTDNIILPISILGIQYLVGDYTNTEQDGQGNANTEVTGNSIVVKGVGVGDKALFFATNSSMIKLYRHILSNITISDLKDALTGKGKGLYQGVLPVSFSYDYYRNGIRVRQLINSDLVISVNYNPAIIFDAIITSGHSGQLTPRYHGYPQQVVSAEGTYSVRVTGDFTNGLRTKVLNTATEYTLKNNEVQSNDTAHQIAYSVTCIAGCTGNSNIITNGVASTEFTQIDNSNTESVDIELQIHFENKPYNELQSGNYQDYFQLLFEAQL